MKINKTVPKRYSLKKNKNYISWQITEVLFRVNVNAITVAVASAIGHLIYLYKGNPDVKFYKFTVKLTINQRQKLKMIKKQICSQ